MAANGFSRQSGGGRNPGFLKAYGDPNFGLGGGTPFCENLKKL
jgi:hypothetical protein